MPLGGRSGRAHDPGVPLVCGDDPGVLVGDRHSHRPFDGVGSTRVVDGSTGAGWIAAEVRRRKAVVTDERRGCRRCCCGDGPLAGTSCRDQEKHGERQACNVAHRSWTLRSLCRFRSEAPARRRRGCGDSDAWRRRRGVATNRQPLLSADRGPRTVAKLGRVSAETRPAPSYVSIGSRSCRPVRRATGLSPWSSR